MNASRVKSAKPRSKRSPKGQRIKSAKRNIKRKTLTKKTLENASKNRRINESMILKRTNISNSSKLLVKDNQSNVPTHYTTMNNNFMSNTGDKRKRIYSAKPMLKDSRKFLTNRIANDPYIVNLSPANKIPETEYSRLNSSVHFSRELNFYTQTGHSDNRGGYQHVSLMTSSYWKTDGLMNNYKINSRSTESSLSNLTHVQNNQTSTQLEILERIREKKSAENELKNIKHIDWGKLLLNANRQLKKVNYKLKNLISNGDTHVELFANNPKEFEILDEIPLYCKLGCKNHTGPARIIIKFLTKGKVKSYVSTKVSTPPVYKSNRSRFTIFPDDNDKVFAFEFLYLMFMSTTCWKVEIWGEFPNEEDKRKRKKEQKETTQEQINTKLAKFVIKKQELPNNSFINKNIQEVAIWNRIIFEDKEKRWKTIQQRRVSALKKREKLYLNKIKHNIYYMNRWNIVREKRKDVEHLQKMEERRQLFKFWWIRKIHAVQILKVVYNQFDSQRTSIYQGYKEKLFAKRIIRLYLKSISRKGPEVYDRTANQIRMSNTASITFMKDICDKRSKQILIDFLKFSAMNFYTKNTFIEFYKKISMIQQRWQQIRSSNERRVELLIKLWDREIGIMTVYWSKHKAKNKKLKALFKKLQVPDNFVREKLLRYYLKKRTHEHVANCYEWIKYRKQNQDIDFLSEDALEYRISMVGNMNKFLFKGVDNAVLDSDYKKEQKILEKIKLDNKHGGEGHNAKVGKQGSPLGKKSGTLKKGEAGKIVKKNKLAYKNLDPIYLENPHPPYFFFIPDKQDLQVMIKKATTIKDVDDIDINAPQAA